MDRKDFLKFFGYVFMTSLFPFGLNGWAAGLPSETQLDEKSRKRLIVLFQRGAVDGLSLVIPFSEGIYFDSRPSISIGAPGTSTSSAIGLNATFALHPSLETVMPFWKNKSLAFVHACGSPDPSRSHFEAQDYMETGTPGLKNTKDGWMNRLLGVLSNRASAISGISVGSTVPRIMQGKIHVANIPTVNPGRPNITDQPAIAEQFNQLYKNDKQLGEVFQEAVTSRKTLLKDLEAERIEADHGAPYPKGFEANCHLLARVIAKDPAMQIAFLDVGGWDTHINQGGYSGQLGTHLKEFGKGIAALVNGLEGNFDNTIIIVMSEFGRTVKENGHGGTDHGHGNVMWILGGKIQGGKVYGDWPGLSSQRLYQNRDLAVTTDFRNVIGSLLRKQFNLNNQELSAVFPNTPKEAFKIDFNLG